MGTWLRKSSHKGVSLRCALSPADLCLCSSSESVCVCERERREEEVMHRRNWFSTVRNTSISVGTASSRRDSSTAVTSSTNPANKQVLPCVGQRPFRFTREGREENSPPGLVCRSNHLTDKFTFDHRLLIVCSLSLGPSPAHPRHVVLLAPQRGRSRLQRVLVREDAARPAQRAGRQSLQCRNGFVSVIALYQQTCTTNKHTRRLICFSTSV